MGIGYTIDVTDCRHDGVTAYFFDLAVNVTAYDDHLDLFLRPCYAPDVSQNPKVVGTYILHVSPQGALRLCSDESPSKRFSIRRCGQPLRALSFRLVLDGHEGYADIEILEYSALHDGCKPLPSYHERKIDQLVSRDYKRHWFGFVTISQVAGDEQQA